MAKARKDATMAEETAAPAEAVPDLDLDGIEEFIEAEELDNLRAERDEYRDKFMRALADAENSRKRADRDRREAEQYGSTRLARDLLPVYDNLKRALDAANDDTRAAASALIEGVELTLRELTNVMTKHGVAPISPAVGDLFDPQHHQAMFEAPLPGTKAGEIIQVMTEGFMLHDRLLRPAQVGVSSNPKG
jgi:molecular chaperone GrpE